MFTARALAQLRDAHCLAIEAINRAFADIEDSRRRQVNFNSEAVSRINGLQLATADSGWIKLAPEDFKNGWTGDVTLSRIEGTDRVKVDGTISAPRRFAYPVIGNTAPVFRGRAAMFRFDDEGGVVDTVEVAPEDMQWDANAEQWLARIPGEGNEGTYVPPDILELEGDDIEEC